MRMTLKINYKLDEEELRIIRNLIALLNKQSPKKEFEEYNGLREIPKRTFFDAMKISQSKETQVIKFLESTELVEVKKKKEKTGDKKSKMMIILNAVKLNEITTQVQ